MLRESGAFSLLVKAASAKQVTRQQTRSQETRTRTVLSAEFTESFKRKGTFTGGLFTTHNALLLLLLCIFYYCFVITDSFMWKHCC